MPAVLGEGSGSVLLLGPVVVVPVEGGPTLLLGVIDGVALVGELGAEPLLDTVGRGVVELPGKAVGDTDRPPPGPLVGTGTGRAGAGGASKK